MVHVRLVTDEIAMATRTTCPPPSSCPPSITTGVSNTFSVDAASISSPLGSDPRRGVCRVVPAPLE